MRSGVQGRLCTFTMPAPPADAGCDANVHRNGNTGDVWCRLRDPNTRPSHYEAHVRRVPRISVCKLESAGIRASTKLRGRFLGRRFVRGTPGLSPFELL